MADIKEESIKLLLKTVDADFFTISLKHVELHAYLGLLEQERTVGNIFYVNCSVRIPATSASTAEDINLIVSYADLFNLIKSAMCIPCKFLETKAIDIAREIMQKWENIIDGEIEIIKSNPPISGFCGEAGVKYTFARHK